MTDRITYIALLFLRFLSLNLSKNGRFQLGKIVGNLLRVLSKKRSNITLDNIQKAFPEKSSIEVDKIHKGSYHNLGISLVEMIIIDHLDDEKLAEYIKIDNVDLIHKVLNRGNGLIFLSAHFGNWELLANAGSRFSKVKFNLVVKTQKNKLVNDYLIKLRSNPFLELIDMDKSARKLVQTMQKKESIAMIVDQSAKKQKDILVEFFGRPAWTYEAPAKLSLKFNVPMIFSVPVRNSDNTYTMELEEIDTDGLENNEEGILELTKRHVKALENKIKEHPEQWSWQHRRWKNT